MSRFITARGILLAALMLVAMACSDSSPEKTTTDGTRVPTTAAASDALNAEDVTVPSEPSTSTTQPDETPETSTPGTAPESEPETTTPDTVPESEPETATPDTDSDAAALLTAAGREATGRSVRGEFKLQIGPADSGMALETTTFETDADGNTGLIVSFPDPSSSSELRYVGGTLYVRLPQELLSSYGVDPASGATWLTVDEETSGQMGFTCVSPLSSMGPGTASADCDPMGDTAALLPEFADHATIVGRAVVRGVDTSVVRLAVSIGDLLAGVAGSMPDAADESGEVDALAEAFSFISGDIHIDVWIDDDNRIHRLAVDVASLMAGMAGAAGEDPDEIPQLMVVIDYYDHDADFTIEAPPAEEILGDFADYVGPGPDTF